MDNSRNKLWIDSPVQTLEGHHIQNPIYLPFIFTILLQRPNHKMSKPEEKPQENSQPPLQSKPIVTHLLPGLTVLVILITAALLFDWIATNQERNEVRRLAPLTSPQVEVGTVIQQAAFYQPDLLPVYGSSEMVMTTTPYRAMNFFSTFPTGFDIIDIAKAGDSPINIAQDIASLGASLKGKKIVISFAPGMFAQPQAKQDAYKGNFSMLHASSLIFSPYLSLTVKNEAAQRMMEYPDTLNDNLLIQFAIYNLMQNTRVNNYIYYSLVPLGQLNNFIFRLKDHFAIIKNLWVLHGSSSKPETRTIDWKAAISNAEAVQKLNTKNNPYGLDNQIWSHHGYLGFEFHAPGSQDQNYLYKLSKSQEWGDLSILLQVLKEMGAKPLILSRPINGTLYTAAGISPKAQQAYYSNLKEVVGTYNFPLVDFEQYTGDQYFSVDYASHTSPKGWVLVDQILDAFYHNKPLQ